MAHGNILDNQSPYGYCVGMVLSESAAVEQVTHYYPYGLPFASSTSRDLQSFKYNGKELDTEDNLNWMDYGARMYDAALGRWNGVDALAEKYPNVSPYNYCVNNPIKYVDIYGMGPEDRVKKARSMVGTPYEQEIESKLRTEDTKAALEFMDCSEFVCRVLAADGLTDGVKHMDTSAIFKYLSDEKTFEHSETPTFGDFAVWDGHVGIVSDVDGSRIKLIHARGYHKKSAENSTCIEPSAYRSSKFHGYYHPNSENNGQDNSVIYNGGILSEIIVIGEGKSKIISKTTIN